MAFNGSGVFVRLYNWVNDKNAAIKIRADRMDAEMDGFATGLSGCVTRDGQSPATANLPMGGFKHTNAAVATARSDYATYGQLQDSAGQYVATVGGTATAITLTPSPAITAYATGQAFKFKTGSAATGATTVAISGLTAKTVVNQDGGAIVSGQWASGELITITYDGTNFIAQNRNFVSPVVVGDITVGNVKASGSAGVVIQNSAGTTVATIGSAASVNSSFAGPVTITNSSGTGLTITNTGTSDCIRVLDASGDATYWQIDDSGRQIQGHSAYLTLLGGDQQLIGTSAVSRAFASYSNDALGPTAISFKSRNATIGSYSAVQSGDVLYRWRAYGDDGAAINEGGRMQFAVDAAVSSGIVPTGFSVLTRNTSGTLASRFGITSNGVVTFPSISTTASAANAFLDSGASNSLLRSTSSLRYKKDVEDLSAEYARKALQMRPVWYRSKAEADNPAWSYFGLIAEELAEIEPRLVHYAYADDAYNVTHDADGNEVRTLKDGAQKVPDGVQYERLVVLLLSLVKEQDARIAKLEAVK